MAAVGNRATSTNKASVTSKAIEVQLLKPKMCNFCLKKPSLREGSVQQAAELDLKPGVKAPLQESFLFIDNVRCS